jgi:transmembrane sensor
MIHDPEYIEQLVYKFKNSSINPYELQVLIDWYNSHDDTTVTIPLSDDESHHQIKTRILDGLLSKIEEDKPIHYPRANIRKFYWIAAAAIIVAFIALFWTDEVYMHKEVTPPTVSTTIEPGGNKATLTLADGTQINLSTSQDGIVVKNGISYGDGTTLQENGLLDHVYRKVAQLVLQTPRGGTYRVTLPDGTQVWLNAASKLTYPTHFTDKQRVVELVGEAYFDVQSAYRNDGSKIPFKVISNQQEIDVLGTQFNISAYPDQASSKTTLIEGKIVLTDQHKQVVLSPGDQAITTHLGTRVQQVNTRNYMAWRDGKFSFDGKSFEEVMTEIGHWYDLTIAYEGRVPDVELAGDAFRNQNIGLVLRVLDVADINYSLDVAKRKLTIKEKK